MVAASVARNLFEIENARNLLAAELASTFVPTPEFWRLLSPKNQIVFGTRGSGKTALARVLSHDVLALIPEERTARMIQQRSFIGMFLSARPEWASLGDVGTSVDPGDKQRRFIWRFNIALAHACTATLQSCLHYYVDDERDKANSELAIAQALGRFWLPPKTEVETLRQLRLELEQLEYDGLIADLRSHFGVPSPGWAQGIELAAEAFLPVRQAMLIGRKVFGLTDETSWFVILDEAELLSEYQWRVLNTHMRGAPRGMFLKITTMPFHHPTSETAAGVPVVQGHDFEYVWIGRQPARQGRLSSRSPGDRRREDVGALEFANSLFRKRAEQSGRRFKNVTLKSLLGKDSELLSASEEDNRSSDLHLEMKLIRQFASKETIARAQRLLKAGRTVDFKNQVWRKMKGTIELRAAEANQRGRKRRPIYYGETVVVRLGDNNPRRLIRIFNRLLLSASRKPLRRGDPLPKEIQDRELSRLSKSEASWVRSETKVGPELFDLVFKVGRFFKHHLHSERLATDQVSAFRFDLPTSDSRWQALARGFGVGIICQNDATSEGLPSFDDAFRLSFVLAPYFRLIPRRGKVRSLKTILTWADRHEAAISRDAGQLNETELASAYAND